MTQPDQSAEITFKAIFESIPISIWVEDFSAVVAALDTLRDQGVVDIGSYLQDHPVAADEQQPTRPLTNRRMEPVV